MAWTGKLPVDLLDDGMIDSGDYADWAQTCWVIKRHQDDRVTLDFLMGDIPLNGVEEPLVIGIWRRDGSAYLNDGHHRAVALFELGIKEFPYRWGWKSHGYPLTSEEEPIPDFIIEMIKDRGCFR